MNMHWCTCRVNLSGQTHYIVVFDKSQPVSWPEVQVLMALHGEENIFDIKPALISDTDVRREKERLGAKYGKIVEQVFPGLNPRMETLMPGETEDQPKANSEGEAVNGEKPKPDDDDDGETEQVSAAPTGPATFKPGRHAPPRPV
jgi:hypothetical protein